MKIKYTEEIAGNKVQVFQLCNHFRGYINITRTLKNESNVVYKVFIDTNNNNDYLPKPKASNAFSGFDIFDETLFKCTYQKYSVPFYHCLYYRFENGTSKKKIFLYLSKTAVEYDFNNLKISQDYLIDLGTITYQELQSLSCNTPENEGNNPGYIIGNIESLDTLKNNQIMFLNYYNTYMIPIYKEREAIFDFRTGSFLDKNDINKPIKKFSFELTISSNKCYYIGTLYEYGNMNRMSIHYNYSKNRGVLNIAKYGNIVYGDLSNLNEYLKYSSDFKVYIYNSFSEDIVVKIDYYKLQNYNTVKEVDYDTIKNNLKNISVWSNESYKNCTDNVLCIDNNNNLILKNKSKIHYISYNNYYNKGNSSQRPILKNSDEGSEYYDTTLKKKILWNGTNWTNLDGTSLDLKKSGTTAERPANVDIGFIYKDTTLNKLILWEGNKWVNLDGTELS